jgi:outer membrane receptor protein involved in Fe transport
MGSSRTFTLPQDKEISPFVYLGFDGNDNGNPNLEISTNYNFDIKWDYYISNNELFSINGFYKYILKPIARVDQGNSAGLKTFDNVADYAIAAGVEVEVRKKILSIANKHAVNLGLNASYIYSKINLDPVWFVQNTSSTLEGAAPYIANVDLTYNMTLDKFSIISALVLNYMSDKVHTIGTRGYNNLIEESVTTLDFVSSIRINKNFGINLKARNLLNPEAKLTRMAADNSTFPSVVIRSYRKGVNFDLGLTYKF